MRHAIILLAVILATGCTSSPHTVSSEPSDVAPNPSTQSAPARDLLDYVKAQNTTGFLILRNGKTLIEKNWPAPEDKTFSLFQYGMANDGALLEDVASQQKSFLAILMGVAIDKGLVDVNRPVSDYIGTGWSKAAPEKEALIKVDNVLMMNTGLTPQFSYSAPAGTQFSYNTPVYAISKQILTKATGKSLPELTASWLTRPNGMTQTSWRERPAALGNVGNNTGLVTTPRDTARFGELVLLGGMTRTGEQIISAKSLQYLLEPSATNPAYARLWWLNSSDYTISALRGRKEGRLIPGAPSDLIAALGYLDRRLYVVPSLNLIVVRTGADAPDEDFDQQLWAKIEKFIQS